jgi:hypothetical protein
MTAEHWSDTYIASAPALNGAASQADRAAQAPDPDRVPVDGRRRAELLAFSEHFAPLVAFEGLDRLHDGTWAGFFAADPIIARALRQTADLNPDRDRLQGLLETLATETDPKTYAAALGEFFDLAAKLLALLDGAQAPLAPASAQDFRFGAADRRDALAAPMRRFDRHLGDASISAMFERRLDAALRPWFETLVEILSDFVAALFDALGSAAAADDPEPETGTHAPPAALYIAYVEAFLEARRTLDEFSRRLLAFYTDDVLHQSTLPSAPSAVFLTFTPAQNVDYASVAKDTLFSAGSDASGAAINFASDVPLDVYNVAVKSLRIHRVTASVSKRNRARANVLTCTLAVDATKTPAMQPFPIFGSDPEIAAEAVSNEVAATGTTGTTDAVSAPAMQTASIGFVLASSVLQLSGGTRVVTVWLGFAAPEPSALVGLDLAQLFVGMFDVYCTTAGGWFEAPTPVPLPDSARPASTSTSASASASADTNAAHTGYWLGFQFTLPQGAPPVVATATKPAPGAPAPAIPAAAMDDPGQTPAILARLKSVVTLPAGWSPPAGQTPLSILEAIVVTSVQVGVSVSDLGVATIDTPTGRADQSQSFALLGNPPVQNAAVSLAVPELFIKNVTDLSLSVAWVGLPVTSDGFAGYYQGYTIDADGNPATALFANDTFEVRFGLANPQAWMLDETATTRLFATQTASASDAAPALAPISVLTVPGIKAQPVPAFGDPTKARLLLSLAAPAYAFGNVLYARNLFAASLAQIKNLTPPTSGKKPAAAAAVAPLDAVADANANAPDPRYRSAVAKASGAAVSKLGGKALDAAHAAIDKGSADPAAAEALRTDLGRTLSGTASARIKTWLQSLAPGGVALASGKLVDALKGWLDAHAAKLGTAAKADVAAAKQHLAAAATIRDAHKAAASQNKTAARASMAAAVARAKGAAPDAGTQAPALPNAPWLPTAASVRVAYAATAQTRIGAAPSKAIAFTHLCPFEELAPHTTATGQPLLAPVSPEAALEIELTASPPRVTLLFVLSALGGSWSSKSPKIVWEQWIDGAWKHCAPVADSTNELKNSGIVALDLVQPIRAAGQTPPGARLRVRARADSQSHMLVSALSTNAVAAHWVGPGGADTLGTPLPAGTVTAAVVKIPNIGKIVQPMDTVGGRQALVGRPFHGWMAERLRHKGYAIASWDYARLALAAFPSLWQVAVVEAIAPNTAERQPGQVWIVAVAGPATPNIADPTAPAADPSMLAAIGELLTPQMSPFAALAVTNPPYRRITVVADVLFRGEDTQAAYVMQLESDITLWLSPWPPQAFGKRPRNYYSRHAVAEFVRGRPYVRGISSIHLRVDPPTDPRTPVYFTSAKAHCINQAKSPRKNPRKSQPVPAKGLK